MVLFFLIAVVSFVIQLFLPWWCMAITAFAISFFLGKKSMKTFFAGFFACGLVWLIEAVVIHFSRGDILTNRIAELVHTPSSVILYIVVFLIAGIVGGLSALSGFLFQRALKTEKTTSSA